MMMSSFLTRWFSFSGSDSLRSFTCRGDGGGGGGGGGARSHDQLNSSHDQPNIIHIIIYIITPQKDIDIYNIMYLVGSSKKLENNFHSQCASLHRVPTFHGLLLCQYQAEVTKPVTSWHSIPCHTTWPVEPASLGTPRASVLAAVAPHSSTLSNGSLPVCCANDRHWNPPNACTQLPSSFYRYM